MRSLRTPLSVFMLGFALAAFAQTDAPKSAQPAPSSAQKSFDALKTLAGVWGAKLAVDPPQPDWNGQQMQVSMRITSRGNALVHEMYAAGAPDDPAKYDHPLTMLYLDGDRINLVHYCDAGNRPHMVARPSPDGKTVEFDFADLTGGTKYGHMHHAKFTVIDANHHTEDWTYMMPGDKPVHVHLDLRRTEKTGGSASGR